MARVRSYVLYASYKGRDPKCDRRLEKAAGKRSSGSGYSVMSGERDFDWEFKEKTAAKRAQKRVQKAGKSCHVKTLVYKDDE